MPLAQTQETLLMSVEESLNVVGWQAKSDSGSR